jgi:hypothetical protein
MLEQLCPLLTAAIRKHTHSHRRDEKVMMLHGDN